MTVGGIVQAVERAIADGIAAARAARPLAEGSPLAVELGTRYPILQGPMTRVSDVAPFAEAVAREGGLPFVALAMLRGAEVRALLTRRPTGWRAGPGAWASSGSCSPELRAEQLAAVGEVRPPWALIAGGRPDQAAGLERQGIRTFLHVPSPGLLDQYLRDGCRRFVLEGRECGGHVGPRSSFVLWEQAVAVVADAIERGIPAGEISLVFAGGIHDARSAALVAAMAGPLAARGVKIGVLAGTAYLFTREAVETGAIVRRFQEEAIRCGETVLLESGPGHQVRVSPTPFVARFDEERRRLIAEGRPADEVREALEGLNVGRLRVAAKGVDRGTGAGSPLAAVDDAYQRDHGLYMLGQAADPADRDDHHRRSSTARSPRTSTAVLDREIEGVDARRARLEPEPCPSDIAIIGMAAVFPGAATLAQVLVQHAARRRRDHRGPPGPLGLAAVLRPRPEGARQDHLEVGRVPAGRRRSTRCDTACRRRACRRSSRRNCWRWRSSRRRWPTPATPSGRFPASGRPWCWAWAAARRNWRWATPSAPTCRCSTR